MEVSPENAETVDAYSQLDDAFFDRLGDDGGWARRTQLNPAIFELLGDVAGRTVLDAGCGHGYLSRLLAGRGARVVGVEPASVPISYARRKEAAAPLGVTYVRRDLSRLGDPSELGGPFDAVVANMVLLDIPDWRAALASCVGALRPGGLLVYSLHHPIWVPSRFEEWAARGVVEVREYLHEHEQRLETGGPSIPNFHRPLSTYVNETVRLGCSIVGMVEPQLRDGDIEDPAHELLTRIPNFIVLAARRDP